MPEFVNVWKSDPAVPGVKCLLQPPDAFGDFTQTDGRIATGENPASANSAAKNVVKLLQSLS